MNESPNRQPAASCGHGAKLPRKQEQAIAALLTAPTLGKAGEIAGVSERTLRNWLAEPAFAAEYRKARERLIAQTVAVLHSACGGAVATLEAIAADDAQPAAARVSAAGKLLENAWRGREALDVSERLAAIEQQLAQKGSK